MRVHSEDRLLIYIDVESPGDIKCDETVLKWVDY